MDINEQQVQRLIEGIERLDHRLEQHLTAAARIASAQTPSQSQEGTSSAPPAGTQPASGVSASPCSPQPTDGASASNRRQASWSGRFPRPLPVSRVVRDPELAALVQSMIDRMPSADGPATIVIGHRAKLDWVQVFSGRCGEQDTYKIRQELKGYDRTLEVCLVSDPDWYRQTSVATADAPR